VKGEAKGDGASIEGPQTGLTHYCLARMGSTMHPEPRYYLAVRRAGLCSSLGLLPRCIGAGMDIDSPPGEIWSPNDPVGHHFDTMMLTWYLSSSCLDFR